MNIKSFLLLIILSAYTHVQSEVTVTPRIYYPEEKLQGPPLEAKIVHLNTFTSILQEAQRTFYELGEKSRLILKEDVFESINVDMFKYCIIQKDSISYEKDEQSYYLPECIILFDIPDISSFPSEFYYIVKIKNHLELGHCKTREGINRYLSTECNVPVEDPVNIEKVEETIDYLEGFIAYEAEQSGRE